MTTKLQKWGNSLAVRIPKEIARSHGLREGSKVMFTSQMRQIIIEPAGKKFPTLKELADAITEENRQEPIDWGSPVGKEIW